jgi:hypothetical protein
MLTGIETLNVSDVARSSQTELRRAYAPAQGDVIGHDGSQGVHAQGLLGDKLETLPDSERISNRVHGTTSLDLDHLNP